MKGNHTGKSVSLNKLLTMTGIIGYVVFLLLLLWMDTFLCIRCGLREGGKRYRDAWK